MLGKWARRRVVMEILAKEFGLRTDAAARRAYESLILEGLERGDNPHDTAARIALDVMNCLHYHMDDAPYRRKFLLLCASLKHIRNELSVSYESVARNAIMIAGRQVDDEFADKALGEMA